MKRFLLKICIFFLIIAVIDIMFGYSYGVLRKEAKGGQTYKREYIANTCTPDILILGSSKADHHYVPSIIQEFLSMSCYNAGEMGCGIIPAYVRYQMVSLRKKPKLILYELTPGFDYLQGNSYSQYLGSIRSYTTRKEVQNVYLDFCDELESLRLLSSMYRNNSSLVTTIKDVIIQQQDDNGYEALYGELPKDFMAKLSNNTQKPSVDSLLLSYMKKLVVSAKADNVPVVFTISPTFTGEYLDFYEPAFELAKQYDLPVFDFHDLPSFVGSSLYFQDILHLNHNGAKVYSKFLAEKLNDYLISFYSGV